MIPANAHPNKTDMAMQSVEFTRDELDYLQSVIRHEGAQSDHWKYPPWSLDLNDQINEALALLDMSPKEITANLQLTKHHLLVIDYNVKRDAKSAQGVPIGANILKKHRYARIMLKYEGEVEATEPGGLPDSKAVIERLQEAYHADRDTSRDSDDYTSGEPGAVA